MAKIPLPERGQPLDLSYIYSMATAINDLAGEGSALTQGNNFVLQGQVGGNKSSKLLKSQVIGGYTTISGASQNTNSEYTATITFVQPFATPPIVTATAVNVAETIAGADVRILIKNVTTTDVVLSAKYGTSGVTAIGVNMIAVGLPSST
jgi:hypothetical protein